jgi:hypothetical protein
MNTIVFEESLEHPREPPYELDLKAPIRLRLAPR